MIKKVYSGYNGGGIIGMCIMCAGNIVYCACHFPS